MGPPGGLGVRNLIFYFLLIYNIYVFLIYEWLACGLGWVVAGLWPGPGPPTAHHCPAHQQARQTLSTPNTTQCHSPAPPNPAPSPARGPAQAHIIRQTNPPTPIGGPKDGVSGAPASFILFS